MESEHGCNPPCPNVLHVCLQEGAHGLGLPGHLVPCTHRSSKAGVAGGPSHNQVASCVSGTQPMEQDFASPGMLQIVVTGGEGELLSASPPCSV